MDIALLYGVAPIFALIFGGIIGSFLNVVILRYGTGRPLTGRSSCMTCATKLQWFELIPLLSFVGLRGKCRTCRTKLSWQYPLVEVITGLAFLAIFLHIFVPEIPATVMGLVYYWIVFSYLIVIAVYDARTKIIPNTLVFTLIALSAVPLVIDLSVFEFRIVSLLDVLAGPLAAAPFAILWYVSKGKWMGFGDAKLAWALGWLLGFAGGLMSILFAFWIGALYSIVLILLQSIVRLSPGEGKFTMKSELPFAPFLIMGAAVVFFTGMETILLQILF